MSNSNYIQKYLNFVFPYGLSGLLSKEHETKEEAPEVLSRDFLDMEPLDEKEPNFHSEEIPIKTSGSDTIPRGDGNPPVALFQDSVQEDNLPDFKERFSFFPSGSNRKISAGKKIDRTSTPVKASAKNEWYWGAAGSRCEIIPFFSISDKYFRSPIRDQLHCILSPNSYDLNSFSSKSTCSKMLAKDLLISELNTHFANILYPSTFIEFPIAMEKVVKYNSNNNIPDLEELLYYNPLQVNKPFSFCFMNYENTLVSPVTKYLKDKYAYMDMSMKNRDKLSAETLVIKREKEMAHSGVKVKKNLPSPIAQQDTAKERKMDGEEKAPTQKKKIPTRRSSSSKTNVSKQTNEEHLLAKTKSHRKKCSPSSNRQNSNENLSSDKKPTAKKSNSKTNHSATNKEQSPHSTSFTGGYPYTSKLSIILLNRPVLLNCTRNLVGKSKEILMCTSDSIEEVVRNESDLRDDEIVQRLLAKSKPYRGQPIHVIFNPKKVINKSNHPPNVEQFTPLHPSAAKHNLLSEKFKDKIKKKSEHKSRLLGKPNSSCKNQEENEKNRGWQSGRSHPSDEGGEKKKLVIRLCRRKKSRTALKRMNVKQIVSSVFRNFFHFYSVLGGHLKSGSVITKSNSCQWLKEAGVAPDPRSQEIANELFRDIAGAKIVLNIFDYMQFLIAFARRQRMAAADLVKQLTVCEIPFRREDGWSSAERRKEMNARAVPIRWSHSLPDL
ncbi:uncharacterized protein CDAR_442511 [Caerostris darwini]|uniref:Uncharacterized protein n=1 Tax=Caerostris darwini TaxID=1538125 RepID=A0AAV4V0W7_9ARAC|nr:uncharacterized protein CDAR_442511 [Caerostris darwini]